MAHSQGIPVLVDGAQAVPHLKVDVQALDCDFYSFSGHKVYGPTGIGVLYGKKALLEAMPPYQGGGDMIRSVTFEKTTYNKLPYKFEAGTPDIAGVIGLGAALEYVGGLGIENIGAHEHDLLEYATAEVSAIPGLHIIGTAKEKAGVLSFMLESIHPHDIGTILDQEGIAIRTGHHCSQPVMKRFGIRPPRAHRSPCTTRKQEVDALVRGIEKVTGGIRLMSDLRDLYQDVILEHSKAPRNFREPACRESQGGGIQSALRRSLHDFHHARWRQDSGHQLSRLGLRDFEGFGFDDDANAQRQNESGSGKAFRRASTTWSPATPKTARMPKAELGKLDSFLRRIRVSRAREVRHACVAHAASRARRQAGSNHHGIATTSMNYGQSITLSRECDAHRNSERRTHASCPRASACA